MDYTSDNDSYDSEEDSGLLKKAFDVHLPENFDPNSVPRDGEEYLHHVIYERNMCKKWVASPIDPKKLKKYSTFEIPIKVIKYNIPLHLLPSLEWQYQKLRDFKDFKETVDKINETYDRKATISVFNEDKFMTKLQISAPRYSTICQYKQTAKIRMLELITNYISTKASFDDLVAVWVFAILVTLSVPLSPNVYHAIREFIRACQLIRSKLPENDEKSWTALNFYICICSRYYSQLDLADFNDME
ncbi:gem-associated protein 2 [Diorhabda carinulata]|uniref:gem-associated protein 2 n=1 Tax=Diorhabda carinulata TaxID=1163345 RepID=UPI0025A1C9A4|nr:gem-associated protein 2 [Diorhabda carinulata]